MAKYRLNFYSIKNNTNECIYFENRTDFECLKNHLLSVNYIKDLMAFAFDKKAKMYKEVKL